jgi:DNA polymerase-3 subunit delta
MARGDVDPLDVIADDIARGELRPIYALGGPETFLVRRAFELLYGACVHGGPRGFNEQTLIAGKGVSDKVISACRTLPMMGPRRTVVVREAAKLGKDDLEALADYAQKPSETSVLLLLESDDGADRLDGRSRLAKAIGKVGLRAEWKRIYGAALKGFVQSEARRLGKSVEPRVADLLEALMGSDLSQIANALQLAALYGDGSAIRLADVEEVATGRKQDAMWNLLDALGERKRGDVLKAFQSLWSQGEEPLAVLRLLQKRVGELSAARAALDGGAPLRDALQAAGIAPNMAWKYEKQVPRWEGSALRRAADLLLDAEDRGKGGSRADPRWTLEAAALDALG